MGDTQPFISLAARFKQQGHSVKLAARPDFASLASAYEIEFVPLGNPYKSLLRSEEVATAIGSGNMLKMIIKQASDSKQRKAFFDGLDTGAMRAVEGAEAVIYKSSWIPFYSIAQKVGVPSAAAMFMPLTRTAFFPSFLIGGGKDRGATIDSMIWRITEQFIWQVSRNFDNRMRSELLGLPRRPFFGPSARQLERTRLYYCLQSHRDSSSRGLARAHPRHRILVFRSAAGSVVPPPDLVGFLESGPPPVSVGFGSMPSGSAEDTLKLILKALELSHQRGILLSGWAGIGKDRKLPEYAFGVESVPHSWLFPRMSAVVHHGGAGTTGAGLRAGCRRSSRHLLPTSRTGQRESRRLESDLARFHFANSPPSFSQTQFAKRHRTPRCVNAHQLSANRFGARMESARPWICL